MGETDDLEWDDAKDAANRAKHGLPLGLSALVFDGRYRYVRPSAKEFSGEFRTEALAQVEHHVLLCVYVWRGPRRRIISLRRAHRSERRAYEEAVERGDADRQGI